MPDNELTREQLLLAHHAELEEILATIPADELTDTARAALVEAIRRDLIIGLYQPAHSEEWRLELNHFGKKPVCLPGFECRKSLEWWSQNFPFVLWWPYPQSDGGDAA